MTTVDAKRLASLLGLGELDADMVRTALLQKQYFANVKHQNEELPPLFSSVTFTEACAKDLSTLSEQDATYSAAWVEYRTRRFDGLVRRLGLPHPVPYARLVLHIADHWAKIAPFLESDRSQIKPTFHDDGRIVQMDYETSKATLSREIRLAHSKSFMVKADVSNCFPSIYSHAIDWALRGKVNAKRDRSKQTWQGELDFLVRGCHNSETKGIMIGPAVSNLLAELVLQRVDEGLESREYQFVRFIDDYTAYFPERSQAEKFVVDLQHLLGQYRLDLNNRKTQISDLHGTTDEVWMSEVLAHLPSTWTPLAAVRSLRYCEDRARRFPHNSVLKFAVKTLIGHRERDKADASILLIDELVRLCAYHPHLVPHLWREINALGEAATAIDAERLEPVLSEQMLDAAGRAETDVVLWYLYILRVTLKQQVLKDSWQTLLDMDDDLVTVAVAALCPRAERGVAKYVRNCTYSCASDYQQHWLARYELWRVGLIDDADLDPSEKGWMQTLQAHSVTFCQP